MFKSVQARYALRSALFGVSAAVVSLQANLPDGLTAGEAAQAGLAGIAASLTYAGIGAAFKSVEPSIGNKQ